MRTACPMCEKRYDIPLSEIYEYIRTSKSFRSKVVRFIEKIEKEESLTPEEKTERQRIQWEQKATAYAAREAKREEKKASTEFNPGENQ